MSIFLRRLSMAWLFCFYGGAFGQGLTDFVRLKLFSMDAILSKSSFVCTAANPELRAPFNSLQREFRKNWSVEIERGKEYVNRLIAEQRLEGVGDSDEAIEQIWSDYLLTTPTTDLRVTCEIALYRLQRYARWSFKDVLHADIDEHLNHVTKNQDIDELQAAASKGEAEAELTLGIMYYKGVNVQKNYGAASRWFSRAASHGSSEAEPDLKSGPYEKIPGSLMWFRLAASQGDAVAQRALARYYSGSDGLTIGPWQDNIRSYVWYKILAANASASRDAQLLVDVSAQRLTPVERMRADQMAQECLRHMDRGCD